MPEHVPSSLAEALSLEEEKEVRLYLLEELKSIIKKYASYYAPDKDCNSHEKEPTPQEFFAWIEALGEGGTVHPEWNLDEGTLVQDVRRFEKLYKELANSALKQPIGKDVQEESGILVARETNERLRVFDEKVMTYMEKLVEEGVDNDSVVKGLAGLDSERAWNMRERFLEDWPQAVAQGLAGLDSDRAWEMRKKLVMGGTYGGVMPGLAGLDSDKAWNMRDRFLQRGGRGDSILQGLAGLDSDRAWNMREHLLTPETQPFVALSLAGLDSDRAWKMREHLLVEGADKAFLAEGLAGLDSDQAWKMRDQLLADGADTSFVARGLAGLDSDRAWKMRERFLTRSSNDSSVALGLAGLDSDRAWEMRERFLAEGYNTSVARGFAGDHITFVWRLLAKAKHKKR